MGRAVHDHEGRIFVARAQRPGVTTPAPCICGIAERILPAGIVVIIDVIFQRDYVLAPGQVRSFDYAIPIPGGSPPGTYRATIRAVRGAIRAEACAEVVVPRGRRGFLP